MGALLIETLAPGRLERISFEDCLFACLRECVCVYVHVYIDTVNRVPISYPPRSSNSEHDEDEIA